MASTAVNSPNRLVSPRAWMSEGRGRLGHGGAWYRRCLGGAGSPTGNRRSHGRETCYDAVAHPLAETAPRTARQIMATIPEAGRAAARRSARRRADRRRRQRPAGHLPAHPAVGRRADLHDLVVAVQPQARAHPRQPEGLAVDHRSRVASAAPSTARRSRATPGSSRRTRTAAGSGSSRSGRRRSRRSSTSSRRAWRCRSSSSGR